jgi:hypothetical protein
MTHEDVPGETQWPTRCPVCGTELSTATIDFDETNRDRAELQPGEMVEVDYCPNPDCPSKREHPAPAADPGDEPR